MLFIRQPSHSSWDGIPASHGSADCRSPPPCLAPLTGPALAVKEAAYRMVRRLKSWDGHAGDQGDETEREEFSGAAS